MKFCEKIANIEKNSSSLFILRHNNYRALQNYFFEEIANKQHENMIIICFRQKYLL